jgi:hypothetical protein
MFDVKDENKNLNKQWEEALVAMTRRDKSLQYVQDTASKMREQILDFEKTFSAMKTERTQLDAKMESLIKGTLEPVKEIK